MSGDQTRQDPAWLVPLGAEWPFGARDLLAGTPQIVRVSVVRMLGSAPREPGASLLVGPAQCLGTIGGGQLELQAMDRARALLSDPNAPDVCILDFTLGPDLNQCCGGRVQLWLERLTQTQLPELEALCTRLDTQGTASLITAWRAGTIRRERGTLEAGVDASLRCQTGSDGSLILQESWRRERPPLWIFGAGHVGQAIVRLLRDLPVCDVTWIDSRAEMLPDHLPEHIHVRHSAQPVELVDVAPTQARFVILTHDHGLDYALCRSILLRREFTWLGLIGSASKRARFRSRLSRDGLSADQIGRLSCPIGIPGIRSKLPAAIAVGVVAQILEQMEASLAARPVRSGSSCEQDCGECAGSRRVAR